MFRLTLLGNTLTRSATQFYQHRFRISVIDLRVIAVLAHEETLTAQDLVRRLRIDKAWVSRSAGKLVRRGFLERRPDLEDRRAVRLGLRAPGRQLYGKLREATRIRQEALLEVLTGAERAALLEMIGRLQRRAEEMLG